MLRHLFEATFDHRVGVIPTGKGSEDGCDGMDSDRQNIKRVPLWNEFPHAPHLEGLAMR